MNALFHTNNTSARSSKPAVNFSHWPISRPYSIIHPGFDSSLDFTKQWRKSVSFARIAIANLGHATNDNYSFYMFYSITRF